MKHVDWARIFRFGFRKRMAIGVWRQTVTTTHSCDNPFFCDVIRGNLQWRKVYVAKKELCQDRINILAVMVRRMLCEFVPDLFLPIPKPFALWAMFGALFYEAAELFVVTNESTEVLNKCFRFHRIWRMG